MKKRFLLLAVNSLRSNFTGRITARTPPPPLAPRRWWMTSSSLRGGGGGHGENPNQQQQQPSHPPSEYEGCDYAVLSDPAPGSPFHFAFPVHDLALAREFYGTVLGCQEGRASDRWQDYALHGHQIVAHWVGNEYRCQDHYNPGARACLWV
jgi:hypothetical protein